MVHFFSLPPLSFHTNTPRTSILLRFVILPDFIQARPLVVAPRLLLWCCVAREIGSPKWMTSYFLALIHFFLRSFFRTPWWWSVCLCAFGSGSFFCFALRLAE